MKSTPGFKSTKKCSECNSVKAKSSLFDKAANSRNSDIEKRENREKREKRERKRDRERE